ncbi:unnamed protein product [Pelagomonas calceolata]|uniref:HEAT repeat-containing protein 1 n=1 Tax=Pelagomonas calceolata TaxID=35677 RepID=A0A8J2SAK0_9STRA|nr:unnamed protein product [Pelagomonas calceolata]
MDPRVVATLITIALALGYTRWAKRNKVNVPQCSVPEILHALAHGDSTVRALAGRALRSIIFGEVDVLEDLLDDVAGKHADDFGKKREDGRTLLDIAVEDASNGDADAISLLLAVTELDDAWDVAEDEWNLLVQRARRGGGSRPVRRKAQLGWRASRRGSTRRRRKSPHQTVSAPRMIH